jgi:hypothetical protein
MHQHACRITKDKDPEVEELEEYICVHLLNNSSMNF